MLFVVLGWVIPFYSSYFATSWTARAVGDVFLSERFESRTEKEKAVNELISRSRTHEQSITRFAMFSGISLGLLLIAFAWYIDRQYWKVSKLSRKLEVLESCGRQGTGEEGAGSSG